MDPDSAAASGVSPDDRYLRRDPGPVCIDQPLDPGRWRMADEGIGSASKVRGPLVGEGREDRHHEIHAGMGTDEATVETTIDRMPRVSDRQQLAAGDGTVLSGHDPREPLLSHLGVGHARNNPGHAPRAPS